MSGVRFLVVEDDAEFAENLVELLAHSGYSAERAAGAAQARELATRGSFDVALVDQGLPDGRGVEVIAELRAKNPSLLGIILAAQPTLNSARDAITSGAIAYFVKDGDPRALEALVRRTADQAVLARALRESEARYTLLVERAPLGIALIRDGRYLFANESYARIYGVEAPASLVGQPLEAVYHPDEHERVRTRWSEADAWRESYTVNGARRRDGQRISVSIMRSPFELDGRRAVQLLVRDVTEETRLASELDEARTQVEEKQRLAALGEMVAGIAHEIRNPLQAVSWGLLELREIGKGIPHEGAAEALAKIERGASEIEGIVAQVLDFARPLRADRIPFLVGDLLDAACEDLRGLAADGSVTLAVERRDGPAEVLVDGVKLKRALANLVRNAIEASPRGGRVIVRGTGGAADGDPVVFEVVDEGAGVRADLRPRLFQPFVTTKVKGTGLGLAIARRIVEIHGGSLVLEPAPGQGTVARITLSADSRVVR